MTDAWTQAKEITQRNSGGVFLRLVNDGESFIGCVRGAPLASEKHWMNATEEYVTCTGKGCDPCGKGIKKTSRVMLNVYVFAQSAMKIFECSGKTFEDVCNVRDNFDLGKWAIEVKRNGAAKSTKTKYTVFPKREMTAAERALADAAPLHDLANAEERGDDDDVPPPPPPPAAQDPNARIAAPVVAEFRERLRRLPKEAAYYPILGAFGCERLDEIRVADEHRARTLIERAERGEKIAPPPAKNELDDFA
jgi:hypothetical protein